MRGLVIVAGEVTRLGELRCAQNGSPWIPFTVKGKERRGNTFGEAFSHHDIIAWGKIAEHADSCLRLGATVLVVGTLRYRKDEASGVFKTQINADEIEILSEASGIPAKKEQSEPEEEIPFG